MHISMCVSVVHIHSFIPNIYIAPLQVHYYSDALRTLQHGYCVGVSRATASEGLAQGPYPAARAGFEPTTLRTKGDKSTNKPPRPTFVYVFFYVCNMHVCMYVCVRACMIMYM